jgi:hypothetical protein
VGGPTHVITVAPPPARVGPAHHVTVRPGETRTFRPGSLRAGDVVACVGSSGTVTLRVPYRPSGGWSIGKGAATPSGHGGELALSSAPSGAVTASCRG